MSHADCPATTIAVQVGAWPDPSIAGMVAPPVTVTAGPVAGRVAGPAGGPISSVVDPWRAGQQARSRGNMPVERHRRPAR